jgi:HlyD family secretion protein
MDTRNTEISHTAIEQLADVTRGWYDGARFALGRTGIYTLGAMLALLAAAALYWTFAGGAAVLYITKPITEGTVARAITATGSINPVLTITVGSYVSGVIQEIDCDFNTRVTKGQLCARIDPRPYQTIVDQDRAAVTSAQAQMLKDQANLAYGRVTAARFAKLLAQHATSNDSYDVAVNARNQASAQVALDRALIVQRQAVLDAAQVNLGYTNIVSPVDGTVVSRNVTRGQTVAASFQTPTLFLIATDLAKMQVDTNVSESDVGAIRVGNKTQFRVEAFPDHPFTGLVTQVRQAPQTVQNVVTYDVIVAVDNSQLLLKPGMTATVRIITEKRDGVLRVPDQALRYMPGGLSAAGRGAGAPTSQVWLLRNGKAVRVPVGTGLDDDTFTELTSGEVHVGDKVIVSERGATSATATNGATPAMRFP